MVLQIFIMFEQTVVFNVFLVQHLFQFVHFRRPYLTYLTDLVHLLQLFQLLFAYHSVLLPLVQGFRGVIRVVRRVGRIRRAQLVLRTQLVRTVVVLVPGHVLLLDVQSFDFFSGPLQQSTQFLDFLDFHGECIFIVVD